MQYSRGLSLSEQHAVQGEMYGRAYNLVRRGVQRHRHRPLRRLQAGVLAHVDVGDRQAPPFTRY